MCVPSARVGCSNSTRLSGCARSLDGLRPTQASDRVLALSFLPMSDLYSDPSLYDLAHPAPWKGELEFYQPQAARAGRGLLELACGTGRLSLPLARSGLEVPGLDLSAAMLD